MRKVLRNRVLIAFGWFFILVGMVGVILPVLPTTPFLILALVLFSNSSPRFHRMLLNNRWFGPTLRDWEERRILPRKTKYRASGLIVATFLVSILLVSGRPYLQLMLVCFAIVLLFFIWRIREVPAED